MKAALCRRFAAALGGLFVLAASPACAADTVFGNWLTDDGAAVVRIGRCGQKLCGTIDRVLDPKAPVNDINNPDPRLRSTPLVGTIVLRGFAPANGQWQGGRAYDPKAGRSYRSQLEVMKDGRLKVTGCILFLCRSRHWTRTN